MATQFEFTCPGCDYADFVCGCEDVGMYAVWETMTCGDCRELVDVIVGHMGRRGPSGNEEWDRELGKCPECSGRNLSAWKHPGPCPRCGSLLGKGDSELMVD
jgi:hypothetical protein